MRRPRIAADGRLWRWSRPHRPVRGAVRRAYLASLLPASDMGRICVLTCGRTGSELLVDLLDSHPRMTCDSEVLDHAPFSPRLFIRGRSALAQMDGAAAYGFKLPVNHFEWPVLIRLPSQFVRDLDAAGFSMVRLRRRDRIRQAVSHERARVLGHWHDAERTDAPRVDPADVVHALVWLERREEALDRALDQVSALEVVYEDDLVTPQRQQATADRLFSLLGLEPHDATSSLRKDSSRELPRMVANWDDIARSIAGTRFAPLLDHAATGDA